MRGGSAGSNSKFNLGDIKAKASGRATRNWGPKKLRIQLGAGSTYAHVAQNTKRAAPGYKQRKLLKHKKA